MNRRRSMSKSAIPFILAIMLILQAVTFSAATYADSTPVSEGGSETGTDTTVTEDVYAAPMTFAPMALEAIDKTAVFLAANSPFPLEVKQGTAVIAPGGTIQGRQSFTIKSEGLQLPVNGDDVNPSNPADPSQYIQKGDWIELTRAEHFPEVVLPASATQNLMALTDEGMKQLGTASFSPDRIRIDFNGDDYFYGGIAKGVTFSFETTANSDLTGLDYGESKPISIFGNPYELLNPKITAAYSMDLTGINWPKNGSWTWWYLTASAYQDGYLTFRSTPSAFDELDATIKLPLDGMTFYTNPTEYGMVYKLNSFKVNEEEVVPTVHPDGSLSYVFPEGTGVDPKVEFQAWFHKDWFYKEYRNVKQDPGRNGGIRLDPSVELRDSGADVKASASRETWVAPDWIQASASYDHPNETITWTIDVNKNYNKQGLKDLTITNVLPAGLDFLSATAQRWVNGEASEAEPITPDADSVYSFGEVDGQVQLVIRTKVNGDGGSEYRIDPRANWNLDTPPDGIQNNDVATGTRPAAVTDEAIVIIGAHEFTKTGSVSLEDYNLGGITWTVSLTPQYALPDAVVYDVLVHGDNLNVLDLAVDATGEVDSTTIGKIRANITASQLGKQYHEGSLKSADGLNLKVIPLTVGGEVVADLIKATGYTTDQPASFSFRSLETNPDVLFRQDSGAQKTRSNRALLFDGSAVKLAANNANLHLRMLNKDMLFASKPLKEDGTPENVTPNSVGSYITNDDNDAWTIAAFDQTTKTVTFRLGVNMPGYDTVEMAKDGGSRVITDVRLVDTLPEGWEFVPYSEEKEFELWKGYSDNGSGTGYGVRNNAVSIIEPTDPAHVVSFSHSGNVGTFTFSRLESPYVILVKARPTNEALADYLDAYIEDGIHKQVLYNQADLYMTWGGEEKSVTEQRKIIVPVQTLGKSVEKPFPGVLEWTVNYYPPYHMEQGVYLQDTLGAGMDLRRNPNGELVLTAPSMAVYRAKLAPDGSLERDGEALDLEDPDSEVKVTATVPDAGGPTVLKFEMTDPNRFYQFVYQTEVDNTQATAGQTMGNEVKLVGDDRLASVSAKSETTLDSSDVAASSGSNAVLSLAKVEPDCVTPLAGVEFTLYRKADGTTVAQGVTTSPDGKLNLIFPDPGFYELKETFINTEQWLPTTRVFQVYVGNTPGKPVWVDGVKVTSSSPFVVCTPDAGRLLITNELEGNGKETDKEFTYTVTFSGPEEGGDKPYAYTYTKQGGGEETESIKSGETITLKDGESVRFHPVAKGTAYTVTQTDYSSDGYSTDPDSLKYTGAIPSSVESGNDTAEAPFVNTRNVGRLLIGNTVIGGEPDKAFEYTVEFDGTGAGADKTYTYTKQDSSTGTIKSGGKLTLKHGETAVIADIVAGTGYIVTQADYTGDGYTTDPEILFRNGTIETGIEKKAEFVNTASGSLLIGNTVTGKGGNTNKAFTYTITFSGTGADEAYSYVKSDGNHGAIEDGTAVVTLKHGQTIKFDHLPVGLAYTVVQTDESADEYATDPATLQHAGSIVRAETAEARFVNHKDLPGGLLIGNTVIGNGSDPDKPFEYTITFTGSGTGKTYAYRISDGTEGTIQSGDKLALKHGQTVTIAGIAKGTAYNVVQTDYTADEYTTEPADRTSEGVIAEDQIAEAHYVNARYLPGTLALEATPKKVPGDGNTPSELTATLTDTESQPVKGKEIVFKLKDGTEIGRATTGADGKATILFTPEKVTGTTPEDYEIVASTSAVSPSGVPYNEAKDTVTAMPAALTGVLRDNNTGAIIPNASIVIKNVGTGEEVTITTDEDGRYYHPVQRDEEYTITYTRLIQIGDSAKPIPFTQKAVIENTDPTTEGNLIPAEITAVGIVLVKEPDGQTAQFNAALTGKMRIYLKDKDGEYVKDASGQPKAFAMEASGTFAADGLTEQSYTMEVRYEAEPGKELIVTTATLNVKDNGELNISEELVDPYGTVYDKTTGDEVTGKKIENARVRLFFYDTDRNKAKGYIPGTQVSLPPVADFPPHDNLSIPYQPSDANGFYAFMVFPEADYYLVVQADGYETYTSPMISVEFDIVKHDVPMTPISTSGGGSGSGDPAPVDPAPVDPVPGATDPDPVDPDTPVPAEPDSDPVEPDAPAPGTPEPGDPEDLHQPEAGQPDAVQPGPGGNGGAGNGSESGNGNVQKDKVPKTGDAGLPPMFYMGLALLSLTMIGLLLAGNKKKRHVQ